MSVLQVGYVGKHFRDFTPSVSGWCKGCASVTGKDSTMADEGHQHEHLHASSMSTCMHACLRKHQSSSSACGALLRGGPVVHG